MLPAYLFTSQYDINLKGMKMFTKLTQKYKYCKINLGS